MRVEDLKIQESVVEAVLFTMGQSVEVRQLAAALESSEKEAAAAAERLRERYDSENRGMQILRLEDSYQMSTRSDYYSNLIKVATTPKKQVLTDVVMETLAIIAYKQPITRTELEKIRNGRSSDYAITTLMTLDMIEPVGRKDSPGKPVLYGTSDSFLKRFKLKSIKDLPDYEEFLQKLAEISSWESLKPADDEGYLYEKDVYNPEEDEELQPVESVSEEIAVAAEEAPVDVADGATDEN